MDAEPGTGSEDATHVENVFIVEQPSDGGIYRAGRGLRPRRGFEFPGYCVLRTN